MRMSLKDLPPGIIRYVVNGTYVVNAILLLCHFYFGFLFYKFGTDVLFYYNTLSIVVYFFCFFLLKKGKAWAYVIIVYVEIFFFMILAVVMLGWECGFQQYCIGFVASIIFVDFYMNQERVMSRRTIMLVAFDILVYLLLRMWTYDHPFYYEISNEIFKRTLFLSNTVTGFSFLIMYLAIYSRTVYKLENELLNMANVDALTGLSNRRRMRQVLRNIPNRKDDNVSTFIAMVDIDLFKKINDTYGHDAGDEVLKEMAELLRDMSTQDESLQVCRWGGEEFLIFAGRTKKSQEQIIDGLDDLRRKAQEAVVLYDGHQIKYTVTIGVGICNNNISVEELIKVADSNLYKGKEGGRNQVFCE